MFENVVKIVDANNNLLGTGLLLDLHVITVDHILDSNVHYFVEHIHKRYTAIVIYRGTNELLDIAVLSVNISTEYKPNLMEVGKNSSICLKGYPQGKKYAAYQEGRNITGNVISCDYNYIGVTDRYCYEGYFLTIKTNEAVTVGFSGAPVFYEDKLVGLVARKHIDDSPQKTNVVPISYFLRVENKRFCHLFGKYINSDLNLRPRQTLRNFFHFQSETIDFYGRDGQMEQLSQFCSCEHDIQWWAITGVGGIGKSRLAYEFAKQLDENCWEWELLSSYNYDTLIKNTENIKKNLLIILDYVQQNIYDIGKWLFALSQKESDYKIRVLLLERYGKSYKTAKWIERLNERNCKYDALVSILYNPKRELDPPLLELSSLKDEDLKSIARNCSSQVNMAIDDSAIEKIKNCLEALDPVFKRPLYFIFLMDAWLNTDGNLLGWDKHFVLENILLRELHRIRLIIQNVIDDDLLIEGYLNILAYATILDGLKYPDEVRMVCPTGYQSLHMTTEHSRKDVIRLFQQIGFIIRDSDDNFIFEGIKPDLLGEFYILSNYSRQNLFENLVQNSLTFPGRAFSFFNRFVDDYYNAEDLYYLKEQGFRDILINISTQNMSDEQIYQYAKFLCERIIRDNRKHSEQCLNRLQLLYTEHSCEKNAVEYARGLSNMIIEYNLKKSSKVVSKLRALNRRYSDSYEIAIEYAQALTSVIERKSVRSSIDDFKNLKSLHSQNRFYYNFELNLCYVKALSAICSKLPDTVVAMDICREIKVITQRFHKSEEFAYFYAKSLCSLKATSKNIILELFLLGKWSSIKPLITSFLNANLTNGRLNWIDTTSWFKSTTDVDVKVLLLKNIISLSDNLLLSKSDMLMFFIMVSEEVLCSPCSIYSDLKCPFIETVLKLTANESDSLELLSHHWMSFFNSVTSCSIPEAATPNILALVFLMESFDHIAIDENYEILLQKCSNSTPVQKQYIIYLDRKKTLGFEYIFEKLKKFYLSQYISLSNYFSFEIPKTPADYMKLVLDFLFSVFSQNDCTQKEIVALDLAKLLFQAYRAKVVDCMEVCTQFAKLEEYVAAALWYQKTLSRIVLDKALNGTDFRGVIDKQYTILKQHWNLDIAIEYCNSVSVASDFVSLWEAKGYLKSIYKIADTFNNYDGSRFQEAINKIEHQIMLYRVSTKFKDVLSDEDPLTYLKDLVDTLNVSGNFMKISQVIVVTNEARALYKRFPDAEIANQLCRALCFLSRTDSKQMRSEIVDESLLIYNQYPTNLSIFRNFVKIINRAIPDCKLKKEVMDEIEEILASKIVEFTNSEEIYKALLSILNIKNIQKTNAPLIDLAPNDLIVSYLVPHTQSEIDSVLLHFHIWGTLDRPVEVVNVKGHYVLIDGYARWFVAKDNDINLITARVLAEY